MIECPKCKSKDYTTISWDCQASKSYMCGDDYQDGKILDIFLSGIDPIAETTCDDCKYEGTAKEWNIETEEFLHAAIFSELPNAMAKRVLEFIETLKI